MLRLPFRVCLVHLALGLALASTAAFARSTADSTAASGAAQPVTPGPGTTSARPEPKPQPRPHGQRVTVPMASLWVDDGDTFTIVWAAADTERVRILGIDTPEIKHPTFGMPEDQPWGREARCYALGALAFADRVELLRANQLDRYGRTLGYFFVNQRDYSVEVVKAHLAEETVSHYGDNGFPEEAKAVQAAAVQAGKPPFESPYLFRQHARDAVRGAGNK
jgi:endonuclease YncB( thermonuclease family)